MSEKEPKINTPLTKSEYNFIKWCRHIKYARIESLEIMGGEPIKAITIKESRRFDTKDFSTG